MSIDKTIERINRMPLEARLVFQSPHHRLEGGVNVKELLAILAHVERLETALRNVRVCAANTCAKCCDKIDEALDSKGKQGA